MVTIKDYGKYETAWCPGCGDFPLLEAVKQGLVLAGLEPHRVLFVSGIGQAAKAPHYLNANVFNGLHGRSAPVATGARLANPELKVIVESGDGCNYGEGGNHFLAAIRRNVDMTMLVHDNLVYGLTKGQASPTSEEGFITKAQPQGPTAEPFDPIAVAVAMKVSFVARGFTGEGEHLAELVKEAVTWRGFSLVDILQPCVSFNKVNTFAWFKKRCYKLAEDYDPTDFDAAMKKAYEWGERIPLGVIFRHDRDSYEAQFPAVAAGPLARQAVSREAFAKVLERYA
jgi:2-oxoglutarate ferredoxin oxidoreductase subunit beta